MQGLALGVYDYLHKSSNPTLLKLRIERSLKLKSQIEHPSLHVNQLRYMHERFAHEMRKLRVLRGTVPICCKRREIRVIHGSWHFLDS